LLIVVGAIIISDKEHYMPRVKKIVKSILNDHQNNLEKIRLAQYSNQFCSF
jgi:hypothetical protein